MTATLKTCCEALENAGLLMAFYISSDLPVEFLSYDSRSMRPGTLFVCKGEHFRCEYLDTALDQNAIGYVSERLYREDASYLLVSDIRAAMAVLAQVFYGNVTERMLTVGITGTKGKSTVAFFTRAILEAHRPHSSALISSVTAASVA